VSLVRGNPVGPPSVRLWFRSGPASESIVKTGREDSQHVRRTSNLRSSYPPVALMRMHPASYARLETSCCCGRAFVKGSPGQKYCEACRLAKAASKAVAKIEKPITTVQPELTERQRNYADFLKRLPARVCERYLSPNTTSGQKTGSGAHRVHLARVRSLRRDASASLLDLSRTPTHSRRER
jgi:hypothetical protein